MQKVHGHVLETRDACETAEEGEGKSAQIALASARFLDPRTGITLLICRARDVARMAHHAQHTTHVMRRVRATR